MKYAHILLFSFTQNFCLANNQSKIQLVHGSDGPWVALGFQMGKDAAKKLEMKSKEDLKVIHYGPFEVQYTCIADGIKASLGIDNIQYEKAEKAQLRSEIINIKTGKKLIFRPTDSFFTLYFNLPDLQLHEKAKEVLTSPNEIIFTVKN